MTCQTCTAPTDSTYLCHRCAADLTSVLEQVPDALATVQDTVARLDRVGTSSGRGTERSRPPVNLDALEHQTHLTELVHSWARMVLESETRDDLRDVEPATYLRISMHLIVAQDYAGEMHAELKDALRKVVRAADLPGDPVWLGRCAVTYDDGTKCTGEIRGWMIADDRPGRKPGARRLADIAKCTECKSPCDARQVYANHILRAAELWKPLPEVVTALAGIEGAPSRATVYRWAAEKTTHRKNVNGVPHFRVAEFLQRSMDEKAGRVA